MSPVARPGADGPESGDRPPVDPEPETTTGLEPGGGVPPGETPPAEASVAADRVDTGSGARTGAPWLIIGIILVVTLLVCAMAVGRVLGVY